jgi:signal transduction histidine kinase
MPDVVRMNSRGLSAFLRTRTIRTTVVASSSSPLLSSAARADDLNISHLLAAYARALASLEQHEIAALALTLGIVFFGVVTAIMLVRTRTRAAVAEAAARREIMALKAEADRLNAVLLAEPQVLVAWAAADDEPDILGDPAFLATGASPPRILAFNTWLDADKARMLGHVVDALRARGEGFALSVTTLAGRHVDAEGRAVGGRAVMRLRDASGAKRELADMAAQHRQLQSDVEAMRTLIEALPAPVWLRDAAGRLAFVNAAYARAVDAADRSDAVSRGIELFDRSEREELARARSRGGFFSGRLPAIVTGGRRVLDVLDVPTQRGAAGIGIDATEAETLRVEIGRMVEAHRRTLDQLATGVAMFDADRKLAFYNAAYRALWDLDAAFLDQGPSDAAVLDRLRAARKLPEERDFRDWKRQLHEAYQAIEAKQHEWHLPDGRTLRVVTTPNPEGGITYLVDDVSERLDLERRFDALIRVLGETLDNLAEAIAVFGSDGRVRLHNPAFARMWRLLPDALAERPHIEVVIAWCRPLHRDETAWQTLRSAVTALDERPAISCRLERNDGSVVDCTTVPLSDGATLVAFQDITDTINVERALRERNEALETADQLKIGFVHHVSYELRSPLTNIIGFAHFLGDPATGPLTTKQSEYLSYITASTNALLAIINNILDLATINAGAMTLDLGDVDIRRTMAAAAEGVQDRLVKDGIALDIRVTPDIGSFVADERRLRQILFNLLSNAVGFSPKGETVTLAVERHRDGVVFTVTDRGPGIPPDVKDRVFALFETRTLGSRHRGAGLGLSIVRSFVELHGGTVLIDSIVGRGTTVSCAFPLEHAAARTAAE